LCIREYIAKQSNKANKQAAINFWMTRNAPILKDTETNASLTKNPMQVLQAYMDATQMPVERIINEVDWFHFDESSTPVEVFGHAGSCMMGDESA
jgi:hypothetical protein